MTEVSKPNFAKWFFIPALLGLVAFLVYIYYYSKTTNIDVIFSLINMPIYALATACILGTVVLNAFSWNFLLQGLGVKTSFRRVFTLSWAGIFLDAIVPGAWFGDTYKAYALSRDPQVNGGKTVASIVVKKVFEDGITLCTLALGVVMLGLNYGLGQGIISLIWVFMLLLALPLIVLIFFSTHINTAKKILQSFKRLYNFVIRKQSDLSTFELRIEKALKNYREGFDILKSKPRIMIKPLAFLIVGWLLSLLSVFLVFVSMGYFIPADKIIITNSVVVNFQANGMTLSSVAQIVSSTIYSALGISPLLSVSSSLLTGFASFWFKTVTSFFVFQGLTLNKQNVSPSPWSSEKTSVIEAKT